MSAFTLKLQSITRSERIDGVTSFVGRDANGSFGILAQHARMMTILLIGLARFRVGTAAWRYVATPGGVLYCCGDMVTISARRFLIDDDYLRISESLRDQLLAEEEQLQVTKESLRNMEEALIKRMWELRHRGA